jgi:hypothetical protein
MWEPMPVGEASLASAFDGSDTSIWKGEGKAIQRQPFHFTGSAIFSVIGQRFDLVPDLLGNNNPRNLASGRGKAAPNAQSLPLRQNL